MLVTIEEPSFLAIKKRAREPANSHLSGRERRKGRITALPAKLEICKPRPKRDSETGICGAIATLNGARVPLAPGERNSVAMGCPPYPLGMTCSEPSGALKRSRMGFPVRLTSGVAGKTGWQQPPASWFRMLCIDVAFIDVNHNAWSSSRTRRHYLLINRVLRPPVSGDFR